MQSKFTISAITGIPMVKAGDDLVPFIVEAVGNTDIQLKDGDIFIVAQKIISKSEGRMMRLDDVEPSRDAVTLSNEVDKDPRLVELMLRESTDLIRKALGVIIVRHRLGFVCANAGIDQSNIEHAGGACALLLPEDPDRSAQSLRKALSAATGKRVGVIISDSMNRPWRLGTVGFAIGSAGITVLDDRRGGKDIFGRRLEVTMSNRADSIATAATLVMGETTECIPVALAQGFPPEDSHQLARDCIRPRAQDLFL